MRKQSKATGKKIDNARKEVDESEHKTIREAVGLPPEDAPAAEPEPEPVAEVVFADAKNDKVEFEELGSSPYLLHAEPLKYAVQRIGSKGCDLVVSPGQEVEAQRLASKNPSIEHVIVDPRLEFPAWFVRKGQNCIGSKG